jgi:hypothetical protein
MAMQHKSAVRDEVRRMVELASGPEWGSDNVKDGYLLGALAALQWVVGVAEEAPTDRMRRLLDVPAR